MDKHLNLFYSYDQGYYKKNVDEKEKAKQLEDNITRALIVTLSKISHNTRDKIIMEMLNRNKLRSNDLHFDLQNTQQDVHKGSQDKYLIIIQREEPDITKEKIRNFTTEHPRTEKGNRPDGWIIGNKEVALIESKVGDYKAELSQIYRHLTGFYGFKLNELETFNSGYELICLTWQNIATFFNNQNITQQRDKLLIKEFLNYLAMTGQILDFNYILEDMIDMQIHKDQLNLFLIELDKEIKERGINLKRKERAKHELWDYYGRENNGKVEDDPHYTIRFFDDCIQFYITTKKGGQVNKILNKEKNKLIEYIQEKLNNKNTRLLTRYYLQLINYKLVDHVQGQIRGDKYYSFYLNFRFSEFVNKNNTIRKIIDNFASFAQLKVYKQFELGISIDFFDFQKVKKTDEKIQVREKNKELLEDPTSMVKLAADFIEETYHLYNLMLPEA